MKRRFIVTSFTNYSRFAIFNKGQFIVTSMTDNPNFKTPNPALKIVQGAVNDLQAAMKLPNSPAATQKRNTCFTALALLLNTLAIYVKSATTDVNALVSSGYSLNKVSGKIGELPPPENMRIKAMLNSCAAVKVKALRGAKSYNYQYAIIVAGVQQPWQNCPGSRSNTVIRDLVQGSQYAFRVAGIGAGVNAVVNYCTPKNSFIL